MAIYGGKRVKLIISLVLVVLMLAAITAGCGGQSNSPNTNNANTQSTDNKGVQNADKSNPPSVETNASNTKDKKFTIATVIKIEGISWFEQTRIGLEKFAKDTGNITFMIGPPKADPALQNQILEDQIAQKVDAICVIPISSAGCAPVLKKAKDAGIVVIAHEGSDLGDSIDFDLEAFQNKDYGEHMMDVLAKEMGEKGEYVCFVGSLTSRSHNEFIDAAVALQKQKYPNMKQVTERVEDNEDQKKAHDKAIELFKTYPNLKGTLSCAMTAAPGIGLAVEEKGMQGKISVVGTSLVSVAGQYLKSGSVNYIMFWSPSNASYAFNKLATLVLQGKKDEIKPGYNLGVPGFEKITGQGNVMYGKTWVDVTKDNMDQYNF